MTAVRGHRENIHVPDLSRTSIVAQAMSLQESGLLIHGMEVTDLSTGYSQSGANRMHRPGYLKFVQVGEGRVPSDYPYRRSGLSMARLEELLSMVRAVAAQRENNGEWASVNPPVPRSTFPWGIGLETPDVLVTRETEFSEHLIPYLRQRGFRARLVKADEACDILADLREAEMGVPDVPEAAEFESDDTSIIAVGDAGDDGETSAYEKLESEFAQRKKFVLVAATIALLSLAGLAVLWLPGSEREVYVAGASADDGPQQEGVSKDRAEANTENAPTEQSTTQTSEQSSPEPTQEFEEHRKASEVGTAPAADRADIPVRIDVAGWHRIGATKGREEFMSDDTGMRILVAAKPSPLDTQELLDQAVLTAIEEARRDAGKSSLEVVGTSPAAYREDHRMSETTWTVRLVEGHQMSIGCQIRTSEDTPPDVHDRRMKACDAAINTAHIDETEDSKATI